MKYLIILIGLALFSSFSIPSEITLDCSNFKTGTFEIKHPVYGITTVKRTAKFQYETNSLEKGKLKYKVDWLNDCTYKLTYHSGKTGNTPKKKLKSMPNIIVTITEIDGNSYMQDSRFEGNNKILYTGRMTKVD